jgi:hypothetical protein
MLCNEMISAYATLKLHAEVHWLSRSLVLKNELHWEIFIFLSNKHSDLIKYYKDISKNLQFCYLAEIFQVLNVFSITTENCVLHAL